MPTIDPVASRRARAADIGHQTQLAYESSEPSPPSLFAAPDESCSSTGAQVRRDDHGAERADVRVGQIEGRRDTGFRLPILLTVRDVEAQLQIGRTRTYELLRSGEIPVIRIGRVLRVPREALQRWIENQSNAQAEARGNGQTWLTPGL